MASVVRSVAKDSTTTEPPAPQESSRAADVQSYLISNYREALKRGDKSAAKSCLLAARYFSVNDPNVTNEIYIMAKSDGDVSEASKCFANIFNDLFVSPEQKSPKIHTNELLSVINQIQEETRILIGELKSHFLKLKSLPAPATLASRQVASVQPSPMLSPRVRLSSEDRVASRESITKLDSHLHTSTRSFFYQQLFDNLPDGTKKSILDHSIETCDNPIEKCRLIMLTLSIFSDSVATYGSRLLLTLIDLSYLGEKSDVSKQSNAASMPRSPLMCRYARSLLVLDAIPLVLSISQLSNLTVDVNELFALTLNFYSEHCLETSAAEYEPNELHEGVKKSITARILGTENNVSEETQTEESVIATFNQLIQRYLETVTDAGIKEKFDCLRKVVAEKSQLDTKFQQIMEIIRDLNVEDDISDEFLFASKDDSGSSQSVITPPPKSRGRPKKALQQSVIVSLDDGVKRHQQNKSREVQLVFYSIVQSMFVKCATYLKGTRSRVLINFDNPLAANIRSELVKSSSQRTSRSKAVGQQTNDSSGTSNKRQKLDKHLDRLQPGSNSEASPLNSEHSRKMDLQILLNLKEAHKCLEFLTSNYGAFTKLWLKYIASNNIAKLQWFRRCSLDSKLMSGQHDQVSDIIDNIFNNNEDDNDDDKKSDDTDVKMDQFPVGTSTLAIGTGSSSASVSEMRSLIEAISSHVQRSDKMKTFDMIDELFTRMKQSGLMNRDENYTNGNSIDEYMVIVHDSEDSDLGFLFFDALSIIRYCVGILISIIKLYATSAIPVSDTAVGHTIVLSQFDWPKEYHTYDQCITWLRLHKPKSTTPQCLSSATKFTYFDFFHYIRNPNIIEDFMAMLCQGYTLDIKGPGGSQSSSYITTSHTSRTASSSSQNSSTSSSRSTSSGATSRSGKAITTRGVNKTFKEDLKVAMVGQMKASTVLVTLDMISEFIQTSLIPYLRTIKK